MICVCSWTSLHACVCVCVCVCVSIQMLHQLTARAIIRDWTEGSLSSNKMEHEVCVCERERERERSAIFISNSKQYMCVCTYNSLYIHIHTCAVCDIIMCVNFVTSQIVKKERKSFIINISKDYSIVSQFTSFVAIEEREKVRTGCSLS